MKKLIAVAAVAASAMAALADSIAVSPVLDANGLETEFNLTLDVSATRYLCAAWAETDQGANYAAWTNDNFEVLGEVNAETTSWSFAAPKGWGVEMRALRFFLVEKETRPYDARVEWIESTGAEWINTGYIGKSEDHYYLHFVWFSGRFPMATYYNSNRYGVLDLQDNKYGVALNSGYPAASNGDKYQYNRRNAVSGEEVYVHTQIKTGGGNQFVQVSTRGFDDLDETAQTSYLSGATAAPKNTTASLFLFARNTSNVSTDITQGGTVDGNCTMRLWSCYATHNGTPVLDFIPCVKDGEAMLYERINNRLHRNVSGAGAFIAGPVVEEQLLGATEAASSSVAPARPVALISTTSATTSAVTFSATLAQSASAVSATFAYGDSPDLLGAAAEVSANWTQGAAVTFSATGLSAGARQYGVLTLSQNDAVVRTYGFWFVAAGATGRTVAVGAEKDGGVIEAVVSKAAGTTNVLFVAYGAAQGGDTPESWANCERVCLVDGDAQTIDVTVPGWGDTAAAMRFFLKEYVPYPFDAQVAWIQSTGSEYVDSYYTNRLGDTYTISYRTVQKTADNIIMGACGTGGLTERVQMQMVGNASGSSRNKLYHALAYNNTFSSTSGKDLELGTDITTQTEFMDGAQTQKVGHMGGSLTISIQKTDTSAPLCNVSSYIFARHRGDSDSADQKCAARLYSIKVTNGDSLVREFVPVVKDGVAGLYERVNGTCHWNISGTGAFLYGAAIPETGGEPGAVAASSAVYLVQAVSGTVALRGAYATTADFTVTLGSAGAAATANVVFEYGTTAEYGSSVVVDAAMAPGASRDLTVAGLSANTAYFWRVTAGGEEIASGTFTTQGAYRTVALREVVESAGGETLCCKLDFGAAVQNETCRLVLAYGAEDGDVELSSWENCVVVGTIAPGETSLEYNLPAGLVTGAFKYRFYLVADGDSLPGVTGVPYIESTGSEWINTGWIGSFDDEYDISFRSLKPPSEWFMLGSYGPTIQGRYTVVQSTGGNKYALYFNNSGNNKNIPTLQNVDYRVRASFAYGSQTLYVSEDGGEFALAGELALAENPANTMAPLYLFCRNCANSSVDNVAMARLYACSITHNGTLVRDFAPCVKNGEAGLYDRVSGHFHGNISGAGAFIAGEGSEAPAAVYSYTVPTNGVGVATDYASKAGAVSAISAVGQRVSATASVTALGLGDTYPYFEWWVEGGSVTNAIPFAAIPANDAAETHEYSTTFDVGDAWGGTVRCRFAVSNVYTSATGGTCVWQDKSGSSPVAIVDDCTYTWQDVNGDWNGDWTNSANWASDRPGNCIGVPTATSSVFFPTGSTSRVTMPDGLVEVNRLGIAAPGLSVEFFNASNATTLKPGGFVIAVDTTGVSWNQSIVFDGVSLEKKQPSSAVCVCSASTFALRGGTTINSTVLEMVNTQNTGYTGRLEVGAGSLWPTSGEVTQFRIGGEGVAHVEGSFNVAKFMIGQYGSWGGGTLEIGGANPVVNVSKMLRCYNATTYINPSYVTFDIPAGGWATAPLKGGASADPFAGSAADSANVSAKMIISVSANAPIIAARMGHRRPFKVPLISWPTGITVDRCELVADNPRRVRYAWTYGGTDSEVDDGNPPTGLVAYITGVGGTVVIVR
ncbi:MAG: hypothetical protein J6T51_07365 [Kiritimatiellae bacterium]|nr:hypothetical protein [Kiritimatiellia bacterium]